MSYPLTRPILACLTVVMLWFSPWWLAGKNLAPLDLANEMMEPWRAGNTEITAKNHIVSDSVTQYLVYRMIAADDYRREGWVGWSSLTYGGTAQHANTMALYGDWSMQLHRWFGFWTAWHLGLLGQVMLAAIGMLLWLRGRKIAAGWAICGALLYAANSQFVTWINHRWALGAFCWVPWILWSIDQYRATQASHGITSTSQPQPLKCPSPITNILVNLSIPACIAMAFIGGTLQHMALVALVVVAAWLDEATHLHLSTKSQRSANAITRQVRLFARYATWGVIALALAAPVWLPAADAFLTTHHLGLHTGLHGRHEGIYPLGPLQPILNLAAYPGQIFPSIFGRSDSLDLLKLFKSELFYVIYFGSLPVLIGFLSFGVKRTPMIARILIWAGLLLPLTPLVRPLYQRLYLLFILGGIYAFTHWMQHADASAKRCLLRWATRITAAATTCWLLLSAAMHWQRPLLESTIHGRLDHAGEGSSFGFFDRWMHDRVGKMIDDLFLWSPHHLVPLALWLIILAGLWIVTARQPDDARVHASMPLRFARALSPQAGHCLIGIAVVLETMVFAGKWITWTDPAIFPAYPETPESRILKQEIGRNDRSTTWTHPTHHMARTPFVPNTLAAYRIPTIRGYDSIIPNGINLAAMESMDAGSLGQAGVTHLITWPENPDVPPPWQQVATTKSMTLYRNPMAVPRYAGITNAASPWIPLDESTGMENRREIPISPQITAVRIAENHASGWQFKLPGSSWQNVMRNPDGSMHIPISNPTDGVLEMRYRPPLRRAGFTFAIIGALASISLATIGRNHPICLTQSLPAHA